MEAVQFLGIYCEAVPLNVGNYDIFLGRNDTRLVCTYCIWLH